MVVVSDYVVLRMQMRGNMPTVNKRIVKNIWGNSEVVSSNDETDVEERYNDENGLLLICEGGVVKTVLSTDYLEVVSDERVCEWCGKAVRRDEPCLKCCDWKQQEHNND